MSRSRNQTIALIEGLAHDTALTNLDILAQCRFHVEGERRTANSLMPNLVGEWWDRGVKEAAERMYTNTGVTVSVCNSEAAFKTAINRIPASTLNFEVDPERVGPHARPFKAPTFGTSTTQYKGSTPHSFGTHGSNSDGYSPTGASVQSFPTNNSVPHMVISAFFNHRGAKGRKRAAAAIPNAACQPELIGESGFSKIFDGLSASVKDLGHLFPKGKPSKKWTLADQEGFRTEIGNTVAEISRNSNVPITVCYTEADYARVMRQNPDLEVLQGKDRHALALHYLKEAFEGRDGHQSDPGCYSDDDTNEDEEGINGGTSKGGRKMSGLSKSERNGA